MNRETTAEVLLAIREQLHEISNALHQISLKVSILWEERKQHKQMRKFGCEDEGC